MARIELAVEVLDDFDRFIAHLIRFETSNASDRVSEILQAIQILTHSPLIGRKVRGGKRELVIGQSSRGYIALYRFIPKMDTVFVLSARSQKESRYVRGL